MRRLLQFLDKYEMINESGIEKEYRMEEDVNG
jgi:hypothetical protein